MIVTSVTKIDSRRQKVMLDNEYVFSLYNSEIRKYNIKESANISEVDIKNIENDILYPRAKDRVLYLLGNMDKTEKQIIDKLMASFYPETVIDKVVSFLEEYGYVDDLRYGINYINTYKGRKSRRKIECDLLQKGVSLSVIKKCFEEFNDDDEIIALKKMLNKPKYISMLIEENTKNKVIASMLRRGFKYEQITRCINEIKDN